MAIEEIARGGQVIWGASVSDQADTAWDEIQRAGKNVLDFRASYPREVKHPSGGRILFRSLENPDNTRSKSADLIIIDEAAEVEEVAWNQVLRPMLMDSRGPMWAFFTPKGRNWVWRACVKAKDKPNSAVFQAPTLGVEIVEGQLIRKPHPLENPHISFEEILDIFETSTERDFRQEIMAEFIEESGGVFRQVMESIDVGRKANTPSSGDGFYAIGVDLARVNDYTVIDVFDTQGVQVFHDRFNQISWELQIKTIKAVSQMYRGRVYLDSTGLGDPISESLKNEGISVFDFKMTNTSKKHAIDNLSIGFEKGHIRLMDIPVQTDELLSYEYNVTPSGTVRTNAPSGVHDDCVIALALAYWGVSRKPPGPSEAGPVIAVPRGLPALH